MSLNTALFYVSPDETIQVAKAAFPKGNRYLNASTAKWHPPSGRQGVRQWYPK